MTAGGRTALVVDDSRVVRVFARRILEALSFTVVEAEDGRAALAECERAMPDAILLDWHMPVADGPSFLAALREREGGERPKVIFCTNQNDLDHIVQAIERGANEYIMKPFDAEILEAKLVQVGLI
jgi:two-component system chemotaxis response regulator CheY